MLKRKLTEVPRNLTKQSNESESKSKYLKDKRKRTASLSYSDSGISSMSSASTQSTGNFPPDDDANEGNSLPSLVLLTKDKLICNGISRKKFPNPGIDRSIVVGCYDNAKNMMKLRQYLKEDLTTNQQPYLKHRIPRDSQQLLEESCTYFITLDNIESFDAGGVIKNNSNCSNIMISDIREHILATKCLPEDVSGYWVRIFGKKSKYILHLSLYKKISDDNNNRVDKKKSTWAAIPDHLKKIGELDIELWNNGMVDKIKNLTKKPNKRNSLQLVFLRKNMKTCHHTPLFCCTERYQQVTTVLHECLENGDYVLYDEMYVKFCCDLNDANRDEIEMKLLLWCERSQYFAIQGNFVEAKKLLQNVVENVVSKSPNKVFLLNRAYLYLSYTHIIEGNYGTAEDCLSVLQSDKKNGVPYEDLISFYFFYGVVLLNFSIILPKLSKYLLKESHEWLIKALKLLDQLLPSYFYKYCRVYIYLTKYFLLISSTCETQVDKVNMIEEAKKRFSHLDRYAHDRLSVRLKSLYDITKGEISLVENNIEEGLILIENGKRIAEENHFYEEKEISDKLIGRKEYCNFLNAIEVSNSNSINDDDDKKLINNKCQYSADDSAE